jgi:hypothetical protein
MSPPAFSTSGRQQCVPANPHRRPRWPKDRKNPTKKPANPKRTKPRLPLQRASSQKAQPRPIQCLRVRARVLGLWHLRALAPLHSIKWTAQAKERRYLHISILRRVRSTFFQWPTPWQQSTIYVITYVLTEARKGARSTSCATQLNSTQGRSSCCALLKRQTWETAT